MCSLDSLMLGARLLLAITMVFTFPMECFVCRHALVSVMHSLSAEPASSATPAIDTTRAQKSAVSVDALEDADNTDTNDTDDDGDILGKIGEVSPVIHVALTLTLWGSTVVIAVVFDDLRIVLALTGMP
jgi:type III secretory pathway component EscV